MEFFSATLRAARKFLPSFFRFGGRTVGVFSETIGDIEGENDALKLANDVLTGEPR
jgi:hypothetical protein